MGQLSGSSLFSSANLQAYYTLEDANDDKNSNNLTNDNAVTFSAAKYNNGANFGSANTNKQLYIDSSLSYNGGAFSIVGWVKMLAELSSGQGVFFCVGENTQKSILNVQYSTGTPNSISFYRTKKGVANQGPSLSINLGTSTFNHFAICYDGSIVYGYLNGRLIGSSAASGNGTQATNERATIGAYENGDLFSSIIADDVGFFNTCLTQAQINTLIDQGGIQIIG